MDGDTGGGGWRAEVGNLPCVGVVGKWVGLEFAQLTRECEIDGLGAVDRQRCKPWRLRFGLCYRDV